MEVKSRLPVSYKLIIKISPVKIAGRWATASPIDSTLTADASSASTSAMGPLELLTRYLPTRLAGNVRRPVSSRCASNIREPAGDMTSTSDKLSSISIDAIPPTKSLPFYKYVQVCYCNLRTHIDINKEFHFCYFYSETTKPIVSND